MTDGQHGCLSLFTLGFQMAIMKLALDHVFYWLALDTL